MTYLEMLGDWTRSIIDQDERTIAIANRDISRAHDTIRKCEQYKREAEARLAEMHEKARALGIVIPAKVSDV